MRMTRARGRRPDDPLRHARRRGAGGRRRRASPSAPARALGVVGESGSGKSQIFLVDHGPAGQERPRDRPVRYRGEEILGLPPRQLEQDPRRRHRDDLPGPDDLAQPVPEDPRQMTEVLRQAPGHRARPRRASAAIEMLERVGIPEAARRVRHVSARALGRHAPAGDDRHGAAVPARAPDRRRADDGARRDGAGADPGAVRPAASASSARRSC